MRKTRRLKPAPLELPVIHLDAGWMLSYYSQFQILQRDPEPFRLPVFALDKIKQMF
jgi:hypothetical protein